MGGFWCACVCVCVRASVRVNVTSTGILVTLLHCAVKWRPTSGDCHYLLHPRNSIYRGTA